MGLSALEKNPKQLPYKFTPENVMSALWFQVFLGQRYGFRPLPSRIHEEEMQLILDSLTTEEQEFILEWYLPDHNAVPTQYILQPIDRDLEKYDEPEPEATGEEDPFDYVNAYLNKEKIEEEKQQKRISAARKRWAAAERVLASSIRKAVDACVQTGTMSAANARKYFWSGKNSPRLFGKYKSAKMIA
jgi:hypothetical protein